MPGPQDMADILPDWEVTLPVDLPGHHPREQRRNPRQREDHLPLCQLQEGRPSFDE